MEGFWLACDADGRCDVRYATAEPAASPAEARLGGFRRRRAAAKVAAIGGIRSAGEVLEPLLGWHGPGHNGKTLFRPLWRRLQQGWPAFANASMLAAPRVGICGETSVGEGDCARGWWGSWRGADYGVSLRGEEGRRNCLALCRQCARCAFISYSHANDDCSWYAQCPLPLVSGGGASSFVTIAAPWAVPPPLSSPPAMHPYSATSLPGMATRSVAARHGCKPARCAVIEAAAGCDFALGRPGGRRSCSPQVLRRAAPPFLPRLWQWMADCSPGCATSSPPRKSPTDPAADDVEAGGGACRAAAAGVRRRRPLDDPRVHLWAMVSVSQHELLRHWLAHYARLGIDLRRRATLVLQQPRGAEAAAAADATRAVLAEHGVANVSVVGTYTTVLKKQLVNAHLAELPARALLVYADVDEFFEYPCDVVRTLTARDAPVRATCATMVDRLGAGATLAALQPSPAIEEQFSLCAEIRGGVVSTEACLVKITLVAARIGGAPVQFASSHRAVVERPRGQGRLEIGGCYASSSATCLPTGGFAHYQFYEQSVAFQVAKIQTHLDAGDKANARTYRDYATLFDVGTAGGGRRGDAQRGSGGGPAGSRPAFTPLVFDAVMRNRVSCRHWTCPPCEGVASTAIASAATSAPLPTPQKRAADATPHRHSPAKLGSVPSLMRTVRRAAAERRREGNTSALSGPHGGTCEQTDVGGDCESGTLGAWDMRRGSLEQCARRCRACARCAFVSFSATNGDCSWFAQCDLSALTTLPSLPKARGDTYVTMRVRDPATLPPPKADPCVGLHHWPPSSVETATSTVARDTTIYVSASPRPSDGLLPRPEASVFRAVESARAALGLNGSRVVVVFDGVAGRAVSAEQQAEMGRHLARKVHRTRREAARQANVDVVSFDGWVHQANALRCAMRLVPRTRLVFSIQEDTAVGGPPIDTRLIHSMLSAPPSPPSGGADGEQVFYVKFAWFADCTDEHGQPLHALEPCTPHPATPLLHRIGEWSDRPHFATRDAYESRVFPLVQPTAKVSPEQVFIRRARRPTGLWVYGRRGDMLHDLHERPPGGSSYDVYAYHKSEYRNGVTVRR